MFYKIVQESKEVNKKSPIPTICILGIDWVFCLVVPIQADQIGFRDKQKGW